MAAADLLWQGFGQQKINIHISGKEFVPKAQNVQPGSGDLCFLVEDRVDDVLERLLTRNIHVLEGGKVVDRTGATGVSRAICFSDTLFRYFRLCWIVLTGLPTNTLTPWALETAKCVCARSRWQFDRVSSASNHYERKLS